MRPRSCSSAANRSVVWGAGGRLTSGVRSVLGWVQYRLGYWRDGEGRAEESRSQPQAAVPEGVVRLLEAVRDRLQAGRGGFVGSAAWSPTVEHPGPVGLHASTQAGGVSPTTGSSSSGSDLAVRLCPWDPCVMLVANGWAAFLSLPPT